MYAAQLEILIADVDPTTHQELETDSTLELMPAPMLPDRNTELEAANAGANLCAFAKALALNSQTIEQKDRIYKSCLALLDEHGPDVLEAASQQALVSGTSSLSAVVSIIREQHDQGIEFQPNTPGTIAHSNIRAAGYGSKATIITSQLPVEKWYDIIADPTFADAILDRLVHRSHRIALDGPSMHKVNSTAVPRKPRFARILKEQRQASLA